MVMGPKAQSLRVDVSRLVLTGLQRSDWGGFRLESSDHRWKLLIDKQPPPIGIHLSYVLFKMSKMSSRARMAFDETSSSVRSRVLSTPLPSSHAL